MFPMSLLLKGQREEVSKFVGFFLLLSSQKYATIKLVIDYNSYFYHDTRHNNKEVTERGNCICLKKLGLF